MNSFMKNRKCNRKKLYCFFFLVAAWFPAGAEDDISPESCEVYRQGPLTTRDIAIYHLPPKDDFSNAEIHQIHYSELYNFGGMSGYQDDRPNDTLLVDINIADGRALPKHIRNSTPPQEQTFLTMLISGQSYRSLERLIEIYLGRRVEDTGFGYVENGEYIVNIGPINRMNEFFYGFERVTIDDDVSDVYKDRDDVYIEEAKGQVTAVLRCHPVGSVPVPQCSLYENAANFRLDIGFRRDQMHLLDTIRKQAHNFTKCLTVPVDAGGTE